MRIHDLIAAGAANVHLKADFALILYKIKLNVKGSKIVIVPYAETRMRLM